MLLERRLVVLRLGCGVVLGAAAVAKLASLGTFTSFLDSLVPGPWWVAVVSAAGIVAAELTATLLLASSRWASKGGALAAMLGLAFLLYHLADTNAAGACPCFGRWLRPDTVTTILVGAMLTLCGAAIAGAADGPAAASTSVLLPRRLGLAVAVFLAVAGSIATIGAWRGHAVAATVRPVAPVSLLVTGGAVPSVPLTAGSRTMTLDQVTQHGRWVISFLSPDCGNCVTALAVLRAAIAASPGAGWVVAVPEAELATEMEKEVTGLQKTTVLCEADKWRPNHGLPLGSHLLVADGRLLQVAYSSREAVAWLRGSELVVRRAEKEGTE